MKAFGAYISKQLAAFIAFLLVLLGINALVFGLTFHRIFRENYGESAPRAMLERTAAGASRTGLTEEAEQELRRNRIWALYLDRDGACLWSVDRPEEVPERCTVQDVALFSRGYLADYPVFVRTTEDGLLVLGYPKDSYMKLTSNYYSIPSIRALAAFAVGMLAADLLLLFAGYYFSRRTILKSTGPIVAGIERLADGKSVAIRVQGELSGIAESVNRASVLLSRQNEARANWIRGVSHDIRTPLSMIMGYAEKIAQAPDAGGKVREQAEIISRQSIRIKELVQDLNLVSRLEYEMQPLHREPVRVAKLLRAYAAELLNMGLPDGYTVSVGISPDAETAVLEGDERLLSRAVNNLVQNSIRHNPQGCAIRLGLTEEGECLMLSVEDDGVGLSAEKLRELEERPHYMDSCEERLDLRHGLGLMLVRQIAAAHGGSVQIESAPGRGCKMRVSLPKGETITKI